MHITELLENNRLGRKEMMKFKGESFYRYHIHCRNGKVNFSENAKHFYRMQEFLEKYGIKASIKEIREMYLNEFKEIK